MSKVEDFIHAYKSLRRAQAFVAALPASGAQYEFVVAVHQTSGQAVRVPSILEKAMSQVLKTRHDQLFTEALLAAQQYVHDLGLEAQAEHADLMSAILGE